MERQVRGWIANLVLRIFGVMPTEERPRALAAITRNVLDPWRAFLIRQDGDPRLQTLAHERRGEAKEIRNHLPVRLHQHGGHGIDLGAEVERPEGAQGLTMPRVVYLVTIDVR